MDWIRHGMVVSVALAACGPGVEGDDEHGGAGTSAASEDETSATSDSASASGSATSGSASASGTAESGSASDSTSTSGTTIDTVTATFTEDGPYPPEGGEGGDCSCCGSSLHVAWESGALGFWITMSSPSFTELTVTCPDATVVGLADAEVVCGPSEFTLLVDGLVDTFGEETWTVKFEDLLPTDMQPAQCEYDQVCGCNCVPSSCELFVHEPDDG
ncbi:MAG TPA: hypothetical protein VFG69_18565 [Nannocystaceae bacterium]|nr:hypothetical protein [Nannocystaceae bacterium]